MPSPLCTESTVVEHDTIGERNARRVATKWVGQSPRVSQLIEINMNPAAERPPNGPAATKQTSP